MKLVAESKRTALLHSILVVSSSKHGAGKSRRERFLVFLVACAHCCRRIAALAPLFFASVPVFLWYLCKRSRCCLLCFHDTSRTALSCPRRNKNDPKLNAPVLQLSE
eukprot:1317076-Amphidinium_carterae.1